MVHLDLSSKEVLPLQADSLHACRQSLSDIFQRRCIEKLATCADKPAVILQLVESLARANRIEPQHIRPIVDELIERERHATSAIGKGLAFPHVRSRLVHIFAGAVGIAPQGIHLESLDQKPTKLVFLILSPWDQRDLHLRLLSRLVSLTQDKSVHLRMDHEICPHEIWQYVQDLDERFKKEWQ